MERKSVFPFTAIIGQEEMKSALLLNVINPRLGGVLIKGEKGTAKSTAVRALADLLPPLQSVAGCPFHCDPAAPNLLCEDCTTLLQTSGTLPQGTTKMQVVELPVGATEDRVIGTLDIEAALKSGEKKFEKGLLAYANRNILYVDEINLLDDYIVDVLLDAAAMGVNTIEREGISYAHPANFILVGTMNPEEGDIRPQLLDRFGLSVTVTGEQDYAQRVAIIKNRLAYEADPAAFRHAYEKRQVELARQIDKAKKLLPQVQISDHLLESIAQLTISLQIDGHRADLALVKTALTLAAFYGRPAVSCTDLQKASQLVLPHRLRRQPFEEASFDKAAIEAFWQQAEENGHV